MTSNGPQVKTLEDFDIVARPYLFARTGSVLHVVFCNVLVPLTEVPKACDLPIGIALAELILRNKYTRIYSREATPVIGKLLENGDVVLYR